MKKTIVIVKAIGKIILFPVLCPLFVLVKVFCWYMSMFEDPMNLESRINSIEAQLRHIDLMLGHTYNNVSDVRHSQIDANHDIKTLILTKTSEIRNDILQNHDKN